MLRWVPGVETYTQHEDWATPRWPFMGSIAQTLPGRRSPVASSGGRGPVRVFVTLGTIQPYRFDALIDRVCAELPEGCDVTWQLGCTTRNDLPGRVVDMLPADEFERVAAESDVVISHAGVATALALVEMGKHTILVPRRAVRGEHVDDHQVQVCRDLARRGLVTYREVEDLSTGDLVAG